MSRPFQVGDRVIDQSSTVGTIIKTDYAGIKGYPILVKFDHSDSEVEFTRNGFEYIDSKDEYIRHLTPLEQILL